MNTDAFIVRCFSCQRHVEVTTVHEFHNIGGFNGYSYTIDCECGARSHHDGDDGERIPESLKHAAADRHRAFSVLGAINYQRRNLPSSPEKTVLRNSRLDIPVAIDRTTWLVYCSDNWRVTYCSDSESYSLHCADGVQTFSKIADLTASLQCG